MRLALRHTASAVLLALLAACSGPGEIASPDGAVATPAAAVVADAREAEAARKTNAIASKLGIRTVDYACRTDADCTVKNVGNCCGYYPACVNVASPTFPEQVKAACTASGMSSICGFPAISGCECVQGRCEALRTGFLREDGPIQ